MCSDTKIQIWPVKRALTQSPCDTLAISRRQVVRLIQRARSVIIDVHVGRKRNWIGQRFPLLPHLYHVVASNMVESDHFESLAEIDIAFINRDPNMVVRSLIKLNEPG